MICRSPIHHPGAPQESSNRPSFPTAAAVRQRAPIQSGADHVASRKIRESRPQIQPDYGINVVGKHFSPFKRPDDAEHLFDGLRKAGLPE